MENRLRIKLCQKKSLDWKKIQWAGKIFQHLLPVGEPRCLLAHFQLWGNNENSYYLLCSCTKLILGKILFLRYRVKCSQSDCRVFKSTISPEQIAFFACWNKFTKSKSLSKVFGHAWSKMGVANIVPGLWNWRYLKNECMELIDFLHGATNSYKFKGDWKFLGYAWVKMDMVSLVMELYNWMYLRNEEME